MLLAGNHEYTMLPSLFKISHRDEGGKCFTEKRVPAYTIGAPGEMQLPCPRCGKWRMHAPGRHFRDEAADHGQFLPQCSLASVSRQKWPCQDLSFRIFY